MEQCPDEVDPNTHVDQGIDRDRPCIRFDETVEVEDRTDETRERLLVDNPWISRQNAPNEGNQSQQSERD